MTNPPSRGPFEPPRRTRVLVVDDHVVLREGLVEIIDESAGLKVCGEAANSAEALQVAAETQPDVVVIDVSLGLESGLDLVGPIKERCPDVRVLMLSGHDEPQFAEEAKRVGAMGYVVKGTSAASLVRALRRIAAGEPHFNDSQG